MSYNKRGIGYVPAFQTSAIPFLTSSVSVSSSSVLELEFYNVTKFITVKNTGSQTLYFGFSEAGVSGTNRGELATGSSYTADWRVSSLFLKASTSTTTVDVLAGLSSIPSPSEFDNWSGSAGIG
jgi:hypothetical protein